MTTPVPDLPYTEVGTDLFNFQGRNYILTVDYFSRFIEVDELSSTTTGSVIEKLKSQFGRHGIPSTLRSDCGTQYTSQQFSDFCKSYGINHKTSNPHFQSSNGEAERAVQTVKGLWRKNEDKYLALLDYRTTPLDGINLSPAQLLMGRRPRNKLPAPRSLLAPAYNSQDIRQRMKVEKVRQKFYHDKPTTRELSAFRPGDQVRMAPLPGTREWKPAVVVGHHASPRSYLVQSEGNIYRRNRRHLHRSTQRANDGPPTLSEATHLPEDQQPTMPEDQEPTMPEYQEPTLDHPSDTACSEAAPSGMGYRTRSGREVRQPRRLDL